jgi:hypothetical protein
LQCAPGFQINTTFGRTPAFPEGVVIAGLPGETRGIARWWNLVYHFDAIDYCANFYLSRREGALIHRTRRSW